MNEAYVIMDFLHKICIEPRYVLSKPVIKGVFTKQEENMGLLVMRARDNSNTLPFYRCPNDGLNVRSIDFDATNSAR